LLNPGSISSWENGTQIRRGLGKSKNSRMLERLSFEGKKLIPQQASSAK